MKLFVANWKMHKTRGEARAYADELAERIGDGIADSELVLAPAYTLLDAARDPRARWSLSCQNLSAEASGALTGEVSARMAADAGCRYAIVGHSERRRLFGEDGPLLSRKLARCREEGLTPIYCVGETAQERDAGSTESVLTRQLDTLASDPAGDPLVVAYEPVWAIGSGRAAEPDDAREARDQIARALRARGGLRILYGGSVSSENAHDLLSRSGVDGFLIGGASLSASGFAAIARA